jgi:hypothetical protein
MLYNSAQGQAILEHDEIDMLAEAVLVGLMTTSQLERAVQLYYNCWTLKYLLPVI